MSEKNIHPEDQIDLSGAKAVFYGLLRAFFKALSFAWYVLRTNKYIITIFLVLGMGFGYLYYANKPSHYKAMMIVRYNMLTKKTYAEMIEQLNHLIATAPKARLARELRVPENMADKLLHVDARDMNDVYLANDTSTKVDQPFKIIASLRDDYDFALDSLQDGVLRYLNGSPYLKRLKEEQHELERFRLQTLDNDLGKLDTLKTEYNHFLASSKMSATFYNNASNPADFYNQTSTLLAQREMTLTSLRVDSLPVNVLDGFKLTEVPGPTSIPRVVMLFGVAAAFICFVIAFFYEARKRIMNPAAAAAPVVLVPAAPKK